MKKIKTNSEDLQKDIELFYDHTIWHFITVNGVDLGDKMEIQYLFSRYNCDEEVVCYFLNMDYDEEIPSIVSIIPSAYLGEGEVVDMFDIKIKGIAKGLVLEDDSQLAPLRKKL